MTKTKVSKRVVKKNEPEVAAKNPIIVNPPRSLGKTLLTWLGWGIVYVFVFYLGNLSGEYVAAHLPILPSLPRVSVNTDKIKRMIPVIVLPKVSVAWKWPSFASVKNTTVAPATHTKLVIVRGNFINMPQQDATDDEKNAFVESINALAVDSKNVTVADTCEINPSFIRVKQGESLSVVSATAQEHTLMFDKLSKTVASKQTISVPLSQNQGAYAISCDGSIVGFYRIY